MRLSALLEAWDILHEEETSYMVSLPVPGAAAMALALPGGEPPERLHVTLAFLPGPQPLRAIAAALRGLRPPPLSGTVGGLGRFPAGSGRTTDAIFAPVDVPGLVEFRRQVVQAVRGARGQVSARHDFVPHVTLAYVRPGTGGPPAPPRHPVTFPVLQVVQGGNVLMQMRLA